MKKSICIILLISIMFLSGCRNNSVLKSFSQECGVDLSKGNIIYDVDTHGGFLGDGFNYIKLHFSDKSTLNNIKCSDYWNKMPLSNNLKSLFYPSFDDNIDIPEITNGYYYFYDRHNEAVQPYDDTDILNRPSLNFTFAIYDSDSDVLFLIIYDT